MEKLLLIRADASVAMGTGHVMRMIALGQAWQDRGGKVIFLCAEITPALENRLNQEHFLIENIDAAPGSQKDLQATRRLIGSYDDDSIPVALDGYQFDAEFQLGLKNAGCRLLVMDDYGHATFYHADWVLNQNISARAEFYKARCAPETQLLLGTKFALLRREFLEFQNWRRHIPDRAHKVLVTLGGADPDNITRKVIEAVSHQDFEVKIVVGGSNPHLLDLHQTIENTEEQIASFHLETDPQDMPSLMQWADLAVAAGGSTAWELAFMGIPTIFMILAPNQADIVKRLESEGVGTRFGEVSNFDKQAFMDLLASIANDFARREQFSIKGRNTVSGCGSSLLTELLYHYPLKIRAANLQDSMLLWEWVNDPEVRSSAFQDKPIPLTDHLKWCSEKLTSRDCFVFIIVDRQNNPVGQVRFEHNGTEAVVDVSVARIFRGRGFSETILQLGLKHLPTDNRWRRVKAFIKTGNIKSLRTFQNLGFSEVGETIISDYQARIYFLDRDK